MTDNQHRAIIAQIINDLDKCEEWEDIAKLIENLCVRYGICINPYDRRPAQFSLVEDYFKARDDYESARIFKEYFKTKNNGKD